MWGVSKFEDTLKVSFPPKMGSEEKRRSFVARAGCEEARCGWQASHRVRGAGKEKGQDR